MSKFFKILILASLLVSFFSFSFGAFPDFEYEEVDFPSGPVNISGQASSGTRVGLLINGNFIGNFDVVKGQEEVLLKGDIENQEIALGQSLKLISDDSTRIYKLKIGDGGVETLTFGNSIEFRSFEFGDVSFEDEQSGTSRKISVENELANFTFSSMEDFLRNGDNKISFVLKSPLDTLEDTETFNFDLNYEKFPNDIVVFNLTNVTNKKEIFLEGEVEDPSSPLFFVVNQVGNIGNTGVLKPIPLNGKKFNVTVGDLREGKNIVRLITTEASNPNQFNGEKEFDILVDTIPPEIDIKSGLRLFTNENNLELNISTDAVKINFTFDNETRDVDVVDGSALVSLSLDDGLNPLELVAIDIAGNARKESHLIELDNDKPKLIDDSLSPEEMFSGSKTSHFFFQQISGRTNKPEVNLIIFTLAGDSIDRNGRKVSCEDYNSLFFRNLGLFGGDDTEGPESDFNESQLSLLGLINNKKTLTTKSDGSFETFVALQEDDFSERDNKEAENAQEDNRNVKIGSVASKNKICFLMSDKFGNFDTETKTVTLDAGNTLWKAGEITTIPNNVYASEIENTGDQRIGSGRVEVGVIARFEYIGPGKVTKLDSFRVSMDNKGSPDSKFGDVIGNRVNFRLDKDTGDMLVFFPVQIDKLNEDPLKYPDSLRFAFQARVSYSVDSVDIPIDEKNPIFFQAGINIEKPLDHTKWLTPELINGSLEFLTETISFTQKAVEFTNFASVAGVLTCTGAKFWHAFEVANLDPKNPEDKAQIDEANRRLYSICDRVACTSSPLRCEEKIDGFSNLGEDKEIPSNGKTLKSDILGDDRFLKDNAGNVLGELESVSFKGKCDYNGDGEADDGVFASGTIKRLNVTQSSFGVTFRSEEELKLIKKCVSANWEGDKLKGVDYSTVGGVCFNAQDPYYDDQRCNFFGLDGEGETGGIEGRDPANSIFSSVRCGCITDTNSHLKNWLKIQESIKKCLEQAKIGDVKGSYCERIMSQAVCDVATNIVLPEIQRSEIGRSAPGLDGEGRTFNFLKQIQKTDNAMGSRYSGTLLSQAGLQSDQLINKACVGAITGDWSVLTDNILSALDKNQIEPTFGPPFAESRLQGYNPLTGDLSISYRFTHAAISGGSRINSEYEFMCDPQGFSGEFCPDDGVVFASEIPNSAIRKKTLRVREGGSVQDTVVVTDPKARFWYNKLRVKHTYEVKGKERTQTREFNILHKEETLLAGCHFSAGTIGSGSGIRCDTLFSNDALISLFEFDKAKTKIVPRTQTGSSRTFFSGDPVFLDLHYSARSEEGFQDKVSLAYFASCQGTGKDKQEIGNDGNPFIRDLQVGDLDSFLKGEVIGLFNIPPIDSSSSKSFVSKIDVSSINLGSTGYNGIRFISKDSLLDIASRFEEVHLIDNKGSIFREDFSGLTFNNENANKGKGQSSESLVELDKVFGNRNLENIVELKLISSKENSGLTIQLIRLDGSEVVGTGFPPRSFVSKGTSEFVAGTCELKARLLPSVDAQSLTFDNFDSFTSAGAGGGENIQLSKNLVDDSRFSAKFTVKPSSSLSKDTAFDTADVLRPVKNQVVCVQIGEDGKVNNLPDIDLKYLFVRSANPLSSENLGDVKLRYSLSSSLFGEIDGDEVVLENVEAFDSVTFDNEVVRLRLNRFEDAIKAKIQTSHENSAVRFLSELIEADQNKIPLKLSYTITQTKSGNVLASKDINFFIGGSRSCFGEEKVVSDKSVSEEEKKVEDAKDELENLTG